MAVVRRTVTVAIDKELVDRARARSGAGAKPDADIVEEAVSVYLRHLRCSDLAVALFTTDGHLAERLEPQGPGVTDPPSTS